MTPRNPTVAYVQIGSSEKAFSVSAVEEGGYGFFAQDGLGYWQMKGNANTDSHVAALIEQYGVERVRPAHISLEEALAVEKKRAAVLPSHLQTLEQYKENSVVIFVHEPDPKNEPGKIAFGNPFSSGAAHGSKDGSSDREAFRAAQSAIYDYNAHLRTYSRKEFIDSREEDFLSQGCKQIIAYDGYETKSKNIIVISLIVLPDDVFEKSHNQEIQAAIADGEQAIITTSFEDPRDKLFHARAASASLADALSIGEPDWDGTKWVNSSAADRKVALDAVGHTDYDQQRVLAHTAWADLPSKTRASLEKNELVSRSAIQNDPTKISNFYSAEVDSALGKFVATVKLETSMTLTDARRDALTIAKLELGEGATSLKRGGRVLSELPVASWDSKNAKNDGEQWGWIAKGTLAELTAPQPRLFAHLVINDTATAAFEDLGRFVELGRIVAATAVKVRAMPDWPLQALTVEDDNGNSVGEFRVTSMTADGIGLDAKDDGRVCISMDLSALSGNGPHFDNVGIALDYAAQTITASSANSSFLLSTPEGRTLGGVLINNPPKVAKTPAPDLGYSI